MTPELSTLMELLANADDTDASIVMRQLLQLPEVDNLILQHQDSPNPSIRKRIHQLASILNRRKLAESFPQLLTDNSSSFWDIAVTINVILDQQTSVPQINALLENIIGKPFYKCKNAPVFSKILKSIPFVIKHPNDCYIVDFLISDVLLNNSGNPLLIAVAAQRIGQLSAWPAAIGLVNNKVALRDMTYTVMIIEEGLNIKHLPVNDFIPLTKKEFAVRILAKILQAAYIDQMTSLVVDTQKLLADAMAVH